MLFLSLEKSIGFSEVEAREKSLAVVTAIQGSLVVSKITGSTIPWENAMKTIEILYKI